MRSILTLVAAATTVVSFAQNCFISGALPMGQNVEWAGAAMLPDRSIVGAMRTPGASFYLTKWSPAGSIIWQKRLKHVDPSMWISANGISASSDGGLYAYGVLEPYGLYLTTCAVKTDSAGTVQWARIYGLDSMLYWVTGIRQAMAPHLNGSLLSLASDHGMSVSQLDTAGIPIWTKRYEGTPTWNDRLWWDQKIVNAPNGDFVVSALADSTLMIAGMDALGAPQWAYAYDVHARTLGASTRLSDGTYLFGGGLTATTSFLLCLDGSGGVVWYHEYDNPYITGLQEIGNGHVLVKRYYPAHEMAEIDAGGTEVAAWDEQAQTDEVRTVMLPMSRTSGDSLFVGISTDGGGGYHPSLLFATDPGSLNCLYNTATTGTTTVLGAPATASWLNVVRDTLKTWAMNMGQLSLANVLDIEAELGTGNCKPGHFTNVWATAQNLQDRSSGPLTVTLTLDPNTTLFAGWPTPASIVGDTLIWHAPALGGFGTAYFGAGLWVNSDPGLVGTALNFHLEVMQDSSESTLLNNTCTRSVTVVSSYDPNSKEVRPADFYRLGTDTILDYTIHFQNTGTASADRVVVVDTLPAQVQVNSLHMTAASHPYTYSLTATGILTVTFDQIDLPDSTTDQAASQGLFSFTVRPEAGLLPGQEIANRADIFFDFNPAVLTNTALVTVTNETGVPVATKAPTLRLYPVPAQDHLNARLPDDFHASLAWLVGVDGRRMPVQVGALRDGVLPVPVQHLAPGAYVLTVIDAQGHRLAERFVKE